MRYKVTVYIPDEKRHSPYVIKGLIELEKIEQVAESLITAINAFESFEFGESSVKWFNGPCKFIYNITEGSFKNGDSEIIGNTFANHVVSAGIVRYNESATAHLFESLPSIIQNFINLDFAATFEGNNTNVDLFRVEESIYVSRYNKVMT